jgi:hypothetical protein
VFLSTLEIFTKLLREKKREKEREKETEGEREPYRYKCAPEGALMEPKVQPKRAKKMRTYGAPTALHRHF